MKKLLIILPLLALMGCEVDAEQAQRDATRKSLTEAHAQIGMPDIVNFQERRLAKQILELRDTKISTHTYIVNQMKGCLVYLGASIGYGLPYSVQYTNPQVYNHSGSTLPQADPNGLYMPDGLSATWILLYNSEKEKTEPVYIEPEIVVTPFRITKQECI